MRCGGAWRGVPVLWRVVRYVEKTPLTTSTSDSSTGAVVSTVGGVSSRACRLRGGCGPNKNVLLVGNVLYGMCSNPGRRDPWNILLTLLCVCPRRCGAAHKESVRQSLFIGVLTTMMGQCRGRIMRRIVVAGEWTQSTDRLGGSGTGMHKYDHSS